MAVKTIRDIQEALKALGINPGVVDGIPGPATTDAIKIAQRRFGLLADGIAGPLTLARLFRVDGLPGREPVAGGGEQHSAVPWMDMLAELMKANEGARAGIDERDDKALIADWASDLGVKNFDATTTPWCGLNVAHAIRETCPEEPLPSNILGARNFAKLGQHVPPQWGAVLVFWRESKASGKGHVGFYAGERPGAFRVRGGNQQDSISDTWVADSRLVDSRWPGTAMALATGRKVILSADGKPLSTNEA